jgi:leucyl/phenylalanyl-tRNA--protein transferase
MAILEFPPIDSADEHGLLALGGDLETDSLLLAYSQGIFPWPISDEYPLAWFSPDPRGILFFDKLHLSKSFRKFLKKNPYDVRFNTNFAAVIKLCAEVKRQDQPSTWITQEIIDAYIKLNELGFAYSIETYLDDRLVGGVYGVCINRFYSGESMFHLEDNASKVALVSLMYLLKQRDIGWIDTQMVTPVVQSLGGVDIPRETYLKILQVSLKSQ